VIGIIVPISEETIAELGEDEALQLATQLAERRAAGLPVQLAGIDRSPFPYVDPDTGEEITPPVASRFTA
jgi:hypothetical protein